MRSFWGLSLLVLIVGTAHGVDKSIALGQFALSSKYWTQRLSTSQDGSVVLTTSYRFPKDIQQGDTAAKDDKVKHKLVQSGLVPVDCSDIHKAWPRAPSGVYRIYPAGGQGHLAYCDMTLDGGGWTIFQRRLDGSENFYRKWIEYKRGFGNVSAEHWLGNQVVHEITVHGLYELRINLEDFERNKRFAKYSHFRISNEADGYRLAVSGFAGNAGDSLSYAQGQMFSTYDRDLDANPSNCAAGSKGAWWHKSCYESLLNGLYYKKPTAAPAWHGLIWNAWKGNKYSLKASTMMIRKHSTKKLK
uniref:Microfibril-associated glycoprotein 4-like n=1 Tax=Crassostrea virginica TaxID=6565 RepID=A0A8B8EUR4_CRAVI|nr:microfibril-associated glycoprotein 4-like [Crassostrea virginica]XP_022343706.1 microfibril-associated glycoprotein 4-like [Crassostrea virginica]